MYHFAAYTVATGGNVTDKDMTALIDAELSQRNGHYFPTTNFRLIWSAVVGANVSRVVLSTPTINALTKFQLPTMGNSSICLSPPRVDPWINSNVPIPPNEEFQVLATDGTSENVTVMMGWAPNDWSQNLASGIGPVPNFCARVTASITLNSLAYSALAGITFEQSLLPGTYAVNGQQWQGAGLLGARLVFPVSKMYQGRRVRPGVVALNARGDEPVPFGTARELVFGEHGRFSTTEFPQLEALGNSTATITAEGRLWLSRLNDSVNVTY